MVEGPERRVTVPSNPVGRAYLGSQIRKPDSKLKDGFHGICKLPVVRTGGPMSGGLRIISHRLLCDDNLNRCHLGAAEVVSCDGAPDLIQVCFAILRHENDRHSRPISE
jgi:hypothetical protein